MSEQKEITLGEGNTPLIITDGIYFKCEFKNPTGSHKDRSFAYQISQLYKKGIKSAVISSSGNAAISAANYCKKAGIELQIFVSGKINRSKLKVMQDLDCKITTSPKPVSDAFKFSKIINAYDLRQSTDPNALVGYQDIAAEIIKEGVIPDGVFVPVSSGTAAVGISMGFEKLNHTVPIHIVQTDTIHPISSVFDQNFQKSSEISLADAIVARFTPREDEVIAVIRKTQGSGWVISNSEMEAAQTWLQSHDLKCSYEGACTLAALWKAKMNGYKFKSPVCILTGKYY